MRGHTLGRDNITIPSADRFSFSRLASVTWNIHRTSLLVWFSFWIDGNIKQIHRRRWERPYARECRQSPCAPVWQRPPNISS